MKIRDSHIISLVYILIPVAFIFLPLALKPEMEYLYWFGIIIYLFSGVTLIYNTIKGSKETLKYSILVGIGSWALLILVGVFSALDNNDTIQFWHLINTLESAKVINPVVDIDLPSYIISELLYGENITYVINSIGIILLTIMGGFLGVYAFQKKNTEIEEALDREEKRH